MVFSREDLRRIDQLMGEALLDECLRQRLVQDPSLFFEYGLSEGANFWLQGLRVNSLTELAQAITTKVRRDAKRAGIFDL
jgi:hypothetical protein